MHNIHVIGLLTVCESQQVYGTDEQTDERVMWPISNAIRTVAIKSYRKEVKAAKTGVAIMAKAITLYRYYDGYGFLHRIKCACTVCLLCLQFK